MNLRNPIVLPADVWIIPAAEVDEETRRRCRCEDSDSFLSRPRSRTQSRVLNQEAAELLQLFRTPMTIVEAVLRLTIRHPGKPEEILEQIYAVLHPFIDAGWLVPADSPEALGIVQSLQTGQVVDGFEVRECTYLFEDTEVYQVTTRNGDLAALKIARGPSTRDIYLALDRETQILKRLNGGPAPKLVASGVYEGRSYLATTWSSGIRVTLAAERIRQTHGERVRRRLLGLCRQIVCAFAELHGSGVLHGDIYPRNVLADPDDKVTVIDFGASKLLDDSSTEGILRRGVVEFYEPELAEQVLKGEPGLPGSLLGEQYSVAALLYLVVTGESYLGFSAVREEVLRQIVEERPRGFSEIGLPPWPDFETVLLRGLAKDPGDRFSSLDEFRSALDQVKVAEQPLGNHSHPPCQAASERLFGRLSSANAFEFELPPGVPLSSIAYGAAGISYTLYCMACMRGDADLLAQADAWIHRAIRDSTRTDAFAGNRVGIDRQGIGETSVYFGRLGLHVVQALISQAMGDEATLGQSVRRFVQSARNLSHEHDLVLGKCGVLLSCALLHHAINGLGALGRSQALIHSIQELGREICSDIWSRLETCLPVVDGYLGIAHGRAGAYYSTLMWCESVEDILPSTLQEGLEQLAAYAQHDARGIRWPIRRAPAKAKFMDSWCHGNPGYVHLWTAAYRCLREPRYLEIAAKAARGIGIGTDRVGTLCCGDAGRAYAMIEMYRHTGEREWMTQANRLAETAVAKSNRDSRFLYSLLKGDLGAALLMEDLKCPEQASFPMFGRDFRG